MCKCILWQLTAFPFARNSSPISHLRYSGEVFAIAWNNCQQLLTSNVCILRIWLVTKLRILVHHFMRNCEKVKLASYKTSRIVILYVTIP